jgi:hypothetical protein
VRVILLPKGASDRPAQLSSDVDWWSLRRPVSRGLAAAAVFAVLWFGGISYLRDHGWNTIGPNTYRSYQIAGLCSVVVLLTRQTWPRGTLLVVTLTYPWAYGTWLATDFHLLPFLFAAYTVAATGTLRTVLTPA